MYAIILGGWGFTSENLSWRENGHFLEQKPTEKVKIQNVQCSLLHGSVNITTEHYDINLPYYRNIAKHVNNTKFMRYKINANFRKVFLHTFN